MSATRQVLPISDWLVVRYLFEFFSKNIDNVDKVKADMILSIRNGRSEVVDEHIRLEVDKFGKVMEEPEVTITGVKNSENISSYAYVKKEKK